MFFLFLNTVIRLTCPGLYLLFTATWLFPRMCCGLEALRYIHRVFLEASSVLSLDAFPSAFAAPPHAWAISPLALLHTHRLFCNHLYLHHFSFNFAGFLQAYPWFGITTFCCCSICYEFHCAFCRFHFFPKLCNSFIIFYGLIASSSNLSISYLKYFLSEIILYIILFRLFLSYIVHFLPLAREIRVYHFSCLF